jgi:hypothetical protein
MLGFGGSLDVLSALIWGLTIGDLIGIVLQLAVSSYLNQKHVRELFLGVR